jgi:hypothetical protein
LALKCLLLFFVSIKVACTSTFVIREESTTTECWLRFSSLQEEQRSRTREFRLFLLGFFFPTTSWSRLGDSQIFSCILSFPIVGGLPRSCMCACVSLSHPRRSFEASELEGNTQRAQRHLWRPRKNPIRRLSQVRLVLSLPFPSLPLHLILRHGMYFSTRHVCFLGAHKLFPHGLFSAGNS